MRRTTPTNPAALAWMLVLGHEARATAEDEREVKHMSNIVKDLQWARDATRSRLNHTDIDEVLARSIENSKTQAARIAELEAQLAESRKLAGRWVSKWLELLLIECKEPGGAWLFDDLRPQLEQLAAAVQQEGR